MALGVAEKPDHDPDPGHLVGTHHPGAAEAFRLLERRSHVSDLDVERDVARITRWPSADAATDALLLLENAVVRSKSTPCWRTRR